MEKLASHWTVVMKFDISIFSRKYRENSSFIKIWQEWWVLYLRSIYIFIILFRARFVQNIRTYIRRAVSFSFFENLGVYEIMCKNPVGSNRSKMKIWCMLIAYWTPKANKHTQNMYNLLLFHYNNRYANAPRCYVICILPALFTIESFHTLPLTMCNW
jgi:hypothetical protein